MKINYHLLIKIYLILISGLVWLRGEITIRNKKGCLIMIQGRLLVIWKDICQLSNKT